MITLPPGFAPGGIAVGRGSTFNVCSLGSGSIARGGLRTVAVTVIAPPFGPFSTVGLEVGGRRVSGTGQVDDGDTGALLASYDFTAASDSFVNDVVVTPAALVHRLGHPAADRVRRRRAAAVRRSAGQRRCTPRSVRGTDRQRRRRGPRLPQPGASIHAVDACFNLATDRVFRVALH